MSVPSNIIGAQTTLQVGSQTMPVFSVTLPQLKAVMNRASRDTKYKIPFELAPMFVQATLARFHELDLYLHANASSFLTALLEWYEIPENSFRLPGSIDDEEQFYVSALPLCVQQMYATEGFSCDRLIEVASMMTNSECLVQCKGCLSIWDGDSLC